MKRRDMMKKTAIGAASLSMAVSTAQAKGKVTIPNAPLPRNREMVYRELGKTGIKVSQLGFGSHLSKENLKDEKRRDRQIQEGLENGINLFDIYDHSIFHQFRPMAKSLAGKRQDAVLSLVSVTDDTRAEVEGVLCLGTAGEGLGALRDLGRAVPDAFQVVVDFQDGDNEP